MPTEKRSSNTEMVSVPPYIGLEPLVGLYYPAQCRRCGWVGSSEELTEDDAQCTRDVGDSLCLGDCDEIGRDDLLGIIQAMAKAAQQQQSEPVAWMDPRSPGMHATISNEVKQHNTGFGGAPASAVSGYSIPLYTHPAPADTAEVERLRAALRFYADREHFHFESGNWDTVSGEPLNILWCGDEPDFIEDGTVARNALSASAEPSAPVEIDERQEFESAWSARIERLRIRERGNEFYRVQPNDLYRWNNVQDAWELWQARAALERKPS
ncbi:hypothetical protein QEP21_11240 [Pseudomonas shirazica]|uniref:hypothetical protein n=1 Tax=Pseudomonas shirazica TaxID=1940636 RepID=UPI002452E795|nr:hypothetical protein [Pseudomonas shirazica]MDH4430908.1 hypothetical protein [Pseudomonas shirazica]